MRTSISTSSRLKIGTEIGTMKGAKQGQFDPSLLVVSCGFIVGADTTCYF